MAIEFVEQKKKSKTLLVLLGGVVLIIALIWGGFFAWQFIEGRVAVAKPVPYPDVKINFVFLEENELLNKMIKFERIPSFDDELGRENPFTP